MTEFTEGQILNANYISVTEGKTTPPKAYTEDALLSAMENAGAKDMPEEVERRGIGTPATRAAIIEKLVFNRICIAQKRDRKLSALSPGSIGVSLITISSRRIAVPALDGTVGTATSSN